jgi:hypothetical protein
MATMSTVVAPAILSGCTTAAPMAPIGLSKVRANLEGPAANPRKN